MTDDQAGEGFRRLATHLPQLVFGCRANGERTWPSPQWVVFTGLSELNSLGFGWLKAIHPNDRQATYEAWACAAAAGEYAITHRIRCAVDGKYRWHQTRAVPLPGTPIILSGTIVDWIGSSVDVDDLHRLKQQISLAEQQLRTLVEGVPQLIWRSCDMGNWTWASPQWLAFTGQTQEQSHGRGWLGAVHPEDRETVIAAWTAARPRGILDVEFRVYRASDGGYFWHRTRSTSVRDGQDRIVEWLGTTTDVQDLKELQRRQQMLLAEVRGQASRLEWEIKERKETEARLLHITLHDDLTGLHNRTYLTDRLKHMLDRADDRADGCCAVLLLDLDRFKLVNDSLGHQAGDLLLMEVGQRLHACIEPQNILARLGGDEFALLVEDAGDLGQVVALAERIVGAMRRPVQLEQQEVFTSCSIGVVHVTSDKFTVNEVLRDADIAMYHAKRHDTGNYAVFSEAMRKRAVAALELRTDLRHAVARGEFHLHYQPIHAIDTKAIVGVEALIRWQHPRRGLVPPAAFITVAEESGLIREIGNWVLREACNQLRAWCNRFPNLGLYLNVNTSGAELRDPTYVSDMRDILSAACLDPRRLQLEITESIFLHQPDVIGEMLNSIRLLGVKVALDDFGTGYSSLSYLDRYQVDTIKIDRSFVVNMLTRPNAAAIVKSILNLGRSIGLSVVAEGVEDDWQLRELRNVGCSFVQGYHLGRPMSATDLGAALALQSEMKPA